MSTAAAADIVDVVAFAVVDVDRTFDEMDKMCTKVDVVDNANVPKAPCIDYCNHIDFDFDFDIHNLFLGYNWENHQLMNKLKLIAVFVLHFNF